MYTIREVKNNLEVEPFLIEMKASFTQGEIYATWQRRREVKKFVIEDQGQIIAFFQAIKFPLIFGKNYYYIPYGPVVKEYSAELLDFIHKSIEIIKDKTVVYTRLDFFPRVEDGDILKHLSKTFYRVPKIFLGGSNFQPREEWVLNNERTKEDILNVMHKNTRYCIRLAEKKGVTVKIIRSNFLEHFTDFYQLMKITAERNHFGLHAEEYYKNIFTNLDKNNKDKSFLAIAYLGDKILVIDLIIVFGQTSHYVFSGSSNEYRNLSPNYLVQWQSIIEAKALNCQEYNFGGVNLDDKRQNKDWAGLTDYKVKFGGQIIKHSDFYDIIYQPFWYFMYAFRKLLKVK